MTKDRWVWCITKIIVTIILQVFEVTQFTYSYSKVPQWTPLEIKTTSLLRAVRFCQSLSRLGGIVHSTFMRDIVGSNTARIETIFRLLATPSSYSTCPGLSLKWTGRRLVTDSGTKCAWVIHESKAVQIHVHNNRCCLYMSRVPGGVKSPHNNQSQMVSSLLFYIRY